MPDLIRFANSGDPKPLGFIAGMTAMDHGAVMLLNHLRLKVINVLQISELASAANNIANMLQRIPIFSPIFTGLTIYSIVDSRQKLQALPWNSIERSAVVSELIMQTMMLSLLVAGPFFLGSLSGPLWLIFTAGSLLVGAENIKHTQQLNVSIWKAVGFSLGFYQLELDAIRQSSQLVKMGLEFSDSIITLTNTTQSFQRWVLVKIPNLIVSWHNISKEDVPFKVWHNIVENNKEVLESENFFKNTI